MSLDLNLISLSTEILTLIFAAAAAAAAEPPDYYVGGEPEGTTYLGILGNLRLTCSRARAVASPLFFRRVTLKPDDASVARWNAVLDSPEHRRLVRCAVFDSGYEDRGDGIMSDEPVELTEAWHAAVARLGEFEGLDEVRFRFSRGCVMDDEDNEDYDDSQWYTDMCEGDGMETRRDMLSTVFEVMAGLKDKQPQRRIRSLTVENLQNIVDKKFTDKDCFGAVIRGLEELHVDVVSESDEAAPENSLTLPAVVKFWPAFAETWLRAAAPTLKALTIYCDNYFGAIPFWQGAGCDSDEAIAFPNLRRLALGNYALAYESQLDWLASGSVFPRLESLTLDDCPVMSHLLVYEGPGQDGGLPPVDHAKLDVLCRPPGRYGRPPTSKLMLASRLRWDVVFDRLREGLSTLKEFFFISGPWRAVEAFSKRDTNESVLVRRRYLGYHAGIGPSQFAEPDLRYRWGGSGDEHADGTPKLYWDVYNAADYQAADEDGKYKDDGKGMPVPSNDPKVWKAEREAFDRLNVELAQRR